MGESNYFKYQWKRHIRLFLSDLSFTEQEYLLKESQDKCYKRLVKLYNQKTSKNRENITNLITNLSVEVFFDLMQYENTKINQLSYQIIANDKIQNIINFTKIDLLYSKALSEWNKWTNAGLSSYSPHLFPVIKNSQLLQKQFELKFISLINGKINLKELAFQSQLDLVTFAKYLLPLIKTKAIVLQEIPKEKKIKSDCLNLNLTIKSPLITKKLNKLNYNDKPNDKNIIIVLDSQTAIKYVNGDYIIKEEFIIDIINKIYNIIYNNKEYRFIFFWIKGHSNHEWNDMVDELAKNCIKNNDNDYNIKDSWKYISLETANKTIKQSKYKFFNDKLKEYYKRHDIVCENMKIWEVLSSKNFKKERRELNIKESSILNKIRTETCFRYFNFMYNGKDKKIKKFYCNKCSSKEPQTVIHIILECNKYNKERYEYITNVNTIYMNEYDIDITKLNKLQILYKLLFPNHNGKFIKIDHWNIIIKELLHFIEKIKIKIK